MFTPDAYPRGRCAVLSLVNSISGNPRAPWVYTTVQTGYTIVFIVTWHRHNITKQLNLFSICRIEYIPQFEVVVAKVTKNDTKCHFWCNVKVCVFIFLPQAHRQTAVRSAINSTVLQLNVSRLKRGFPFSSLMSTTTNDVKERPTLPGKCAMTDEYYCGPATTPKWQRSSDNRYVRFEPSGTLSAVVHSPQHRPHWPHHRLTKNKTNHTD